MKHEQDESLVLRRINYGEADRIITFLTKHNGKLAVMARGVRKEKSKLAGGIELFCVSNISFIRGKRDIGTLVSSRLKTNYKNIISDIERTNLAYEVLKIIDKHTEDNCEEGYFNLLNETLSGINNHKINPNLIDIWFIMNLLKLGGHQPNLLTDINKNKLVANYTYNFDSEHMAFFESEHGKYTDKHIKLLRLILTQKLSKLANVNNIETITNDLASLTKLLKTRD